MEKKKAEDEMVFCPVGRFFVDMEKVFGRKKKNKFFDHFDKSRVEFLKAIRSLLDEKIETLEKKGQSGERKRATKIEVE